MKEQDIDRLVAVIADRVKDRLAGASTAPVRHVKADGRPAHSEACGSCQLPLTACASCGVNPMNAVSKWQPPSNVPSPSEMSRFIDHTLLKAETDRHAVKKLCEEARKHRFFSVCVNAGNVRLAASHLQGTNVAVCAVVGFPLGAGTPGSKAFEAREAVRCGATEIDMVLNIGALRSGDYSLVTQDIRKVVAAVPDKVVKVILETGMLDLTQKTIACALAKVAGATFVKTSTGFGPGGATVEDITMMRSIVGPEMGVKASGGVRNYETAVQMLKAGANRLGASSSVSIVTGAKGSSSGY